MLLPIEKGIYFNCFTEEEIAKVLSDYRIFDNSRNDIQFDQPKEKLLHFLKNEIFKN